MTDQTVPVPVDLLKRLFDNTTLTRDVFAGDSVDVRPSGIGALIDIKALIPSPPKVGDVLTEAQIKALPPKSVLRDYDDDLWVTAHDGQLHLITFKRDGSLTDDDQEANDAAEYSPVLVSLPTPRD